MSSIRERAGKWQARVTVGKETVVKTFVREVDAERWARHQQVLMERGEYQKVAPRVTLVEAIERFEREVVPTLKGAKQERYILRCWKESTLAKRDITSIKPADIALARDRRLEDVSTGSVRRYLDSLSAVFAIAIRDWEIATVNPVRAIRKPPSGRPRDRRFAPGEMERIIAAGAESPDLPTLITLAVESGMRRAEMLGLEWRHIDLNKRIAFLPVTKNGESRTVPLSRRAVEVLAPLPRRIDGKVFAKNGTSLSGAFQRAVKRARETYEREQTALGVSAFDIGQDGFLVGLRLHDCRHTCISSMVEGGFNLIEAAAVSGHKTLACLKRYAHVTPAHLITKLDKLSMAAT